jgi:hypothetical protein
MHSGATHPACSEAVITEIARSGSDRVHAARCFTEMLRFLEIAGESREPVTPSVQVDLAWHGFIEHGSDYVHYCVERYGHVVEHRHATNDAERQAGYSRAQALLSARFGPLDRELWPPGEPAACGVLAPSDEPNPEKRS